MTGPGNHRTPEVRLVLKKDAHEVCRQCIVRAGSETNHRLLGWAFNGDTRWCVREKLSSSRCQHLRDGMISPAGKDRSGRWTEAMWPRLNDVENKIWQKKVHSRNNSPRKILNTIYSRSAADEFLEATLFTRIIVVFMRCIYTSVRSS